MSNTADLLRSRRDLMIVAGVSVPVNAVPLPANARQKVKLFKQAQRESITAVGLPKPIGVTHISRKVRNRASFAIAAVSVAAAVQRDRTGRVALGGMTHKPWRTAAADAEMPRGPTVVTKWLLDGSEPTHDNVFETTLAERTLASVIADEGVSDEVRYACQPKLNRSA